MSSEKKSFKSTVWKNFEVFKKDIRFCICLLCKAILSRGGNCLKTFTTSAIRHHLKRKAPCRVYIG